MLNGDPDPLVALSRKVDDLGHRMTTLEAARRNDQRDRKESQERIERRLAALTDTRDPNSLVSKVDSIGDLVQQAQGVLKAIRILALIAGGLAGFGAFYELLLHHFSP